MKCAIRDCAADLKAWEEAQGLCEEHGRAFIRLEGEPILEMPADKVGDPEAFRDFVSKAIRRVQTDAIAAGHSHYRAAVDAFTIARRAFETMNPPADPLIIQLEAFRDLIASVVRAAAKNEADVYAGINQAHTARAIRQFGQGIAEAIAAVGWDAGEMRAQEAKASPMAAEDLIQKDRPS